MDDTSTPPPGTPASTAGERHLLPRTLLLQAARVVAQQLRTAHVAEGSRVGWRTASRSDTGADLYAGNLGIALFLAAYARVDGAAWARDLALGALASTRWTAAQATPAGDAAAPALGGMVGHGARIYGLATAGRLLDEPALLAEAHALATITEPRWITADHGFDVIHGSAGLILASLSLGPAVAEPGPGGRTPLDLVRMASAHLLAHQLRDAPWAGAMPGQADGAPQGGFAHGATGVSVALARAGQALRDRELLAAAARALAFERAHCRLGPGRWRVAPGDDRTPIGWCRGGPGAALARHIVLDAAGGRIEDAAAIEDELAQEIACMRELPRLRIDHLCCGGMSVVEALVTLHRARDDDSLLVTAHARALGILRAAKTRGGFLLGTEDLVEPSLLQGLAGVGYGLLRLAEPATLPCVLTLE